MELISDSSRLNILSFSLTPILQKNLLKLIKWSRLVGLINIFMGALYLITIIYLFIPTILIGILYVAMGIKLLSTTKNLQCIQTPHSERFLEAAFNNLKSYIFINGLILIFSLIFLIFMFITLIIPDNSLQDILQKTSEDFVFLTSNIHNVYHFQ